MKKTKKISNALKAIGPGFITGAADDDCSGVVTYSQTGAQYGLGLVWTALWQLPLLIAVQEACARIGAVTGQGLAGVLKSVYTKKIVLTLVLLMLIANTINIGADIGAIVTSLQLIIPHVPFVAFAVAATLGVILLEVYIPYKKYVHLLKWLALALLAYPIAAFLIHTPWSISTLLKATVIPHVSFTPAFLFLIVGVFGTTISPYMFFWEASQEVEEEISLHIIEKEGESPEKINPFLRNLRTDNAIGMVFSNTIQWFIYIVCAATLYIHGVTNITTAAQAASALQPFAGVYAKDIFALGIIGIGLMAIPVFAGSASYALSEVFGWKEGLYRKLSDAKGFYIIIIVSTLLGLLMNFIDINPIQALVGTAVINGIVAVPLLYVIARLNNNKKVMGEHTGGRMSSSLIWVTFIVMTISAVALLYTFLPK